MAAASVRTATSGNRQLSEAAGYAVRELLQVTVGGNTQRGAVTTVFVWFLATNFVDVGGMLELHAPQTYELRCSPQVLYITLPAGTCRLNKGIVSTTGDDFHHYVTLTLTQPDHLVFPNTAYEFGISAVNPSSPPPLNYWGLVLMNARREVADASMTLEGYDLTDYGLLVYPPLASTTLPTVVNYVRLMLTFQKQLAAGDVGHITVQAPTTTKVLCQQFSELSGGGSISAKLPADASYGTYGTHSCQFQNTLTLHLDTSKPIEVGSYVLQVVVLNPGLRASRDFWIVELHKPDVLGVVTSTASTATTTTAAGASAGASASASSANASSASEVPADGVDTAFVSGSLVNSTSAVVDWRSTKAALAIQASGYGISTPFAGQQLTSVAVSRGCRLSPRSLATFLWWLLGAWAAGVSPAAWA
mmetsp:Transcript_30544/g.97241  ORF Transcript_30544/g.97241 Transcript_30544/m.97241 type:complete len:418 (+) Transcript_30544:2763-4016(+)